VTAYAPRLVRSFAPLVDGDRKLKVYGLYADAARRSTFPSAARLRDLVAAHRGRTCEGDHGVGFVILHLGADGTYLLVSEWHRGDMLRHTVSVAPRGAAADDVFAPVAPADLVACVWELEVMKFERDAWVRTVMARAAVDEAAVEAYLEARFAGWV
jgi:hypothetical protein